MRWTWGLRRPFFLKLMLNWIKAPPWSEAELSNVLIRCGPQIELLTRMWSWGCCRVVVALWVRASALTTNPLSRCSPRWFSALEWNGPNTSRADEWQEGGGAGERMVAARGVAPSRPVSPDASIEMVTLHLDTSGRVPGSQRLDCRTGPSRFSYSTLCAKLTYLHGRYWCWNLHEDEAANIQSPNIMNFLWWRWNFTNIEHRTETGQYT